MPFRASGAGGFFVGLMGMQAVYCWAVYVLRDMAGAIRYVGITTKPGKRLGSHLREARAGGRARRLKWMRSLIAAGQTPTLDVVEWTSDWDDAERRWIAQCLADGCDLVNATDGGKDFRAGRTKSGSYPQIKYVRRQAAASIAWLRKSGHNPALLAKCVDAYDRMTKYLALNRKCGRMGDLEVVFRARFHLAPGLKDGTA